LIDFFQDLFIAGAETTSSSLTSMILYMILYPEVQKQIQDEIDQIVGRYGITGYEVFIERIISPFFGSKKKSARFRNFIFIKIKTDLQFSFLDNKID
jgi:cytochrome P450